MGRMGMVVAMVFAGSGLAQQDLRLNDFHEMTEIRTLDFRIEIDASKVPSGFSTANAWITLANEHRSPIQERYWIGSLRNVERAAPRVVSSRTEQKSQFVLPNPPGSVLSDTPREDRICLTLAYQDLDTLEGVELLACRAIRSSKEEQSVEVVYDSGQGTTKVGTASWRQSVRKKYHASLRWGYKQGSLTYFDHLGMLKKRFDETYGAISSTRPMTVEVYVLDRISSRLRESEKPWLIAYRDNYNTEYSRRLIASWSNLFLMPNENDPDDPLDDTYDLFIQRSLASLDPRHDLQIVVTSTDPQDEDEGRIPYPVVTIDNLSVSIPAKGYESGTRRSYRSDTIPAWMIYREAYVYPEIEYVERLYQKADAEYQALYNRYFELRLNDRPEDRDATSALAEEVNRKYERVSRIWDRKVKLMLQELK